jgi:2-methylcitrate dehydratase PrpD
VEETKEQDVVFTLVRNILNTDYHKLPAEAVLAAKRSILDTLGTTLAGSTSEGIDMVHELIHDWGGKEESTLIAFGEKVPALNAAFINATMGHARDYDDSHFLAVAHSGVCVLPAALAVAERRGKTSGKELITAVALGIDLMNRLGISVGLKSAAHGWHNTSVWGIFGATAACGKILKLNEEKLINAIGIAYSQASGTAQCMRDGALTKRMQPGFAAKAAVLSALLAEKGYTGSRDSLEGESGLFRVYHGGKYDRTLLVAELGKYFEVCNLKFKAYPSCGLTHNAITAALELVNQYQIKPEDVDKITVAVGESVYSMVCLPLETKQRPPVIVHAQFSLPYSVARAFVYRKVCLNDFTPDAIRDPAVLEISRKIEPKLVPELTRQKGFDSVILEVQTLGGKKYSKRVDVLKGSLDDPITNEELVEKFKDCASHSVKPIKKQNIDKAAELILNIDTVDDIRDVVSLIS